MVACGPQGPPADCREVIFGLWLGTRVHSNVIFRKIIVLGKHKGYMHRLHVIT